MDKTILDYDKNLQELEVQREKLEKVMQMMGQEWEESGAGIGWLGSLDFPTMPSQEETVTMSTTTTTTTRCIETNKSNPFMKNILSENTGPSPEYLQSLLNVNETLLAQSLANIHSTPLLTPEEHTTNGLHSPLLTPTNTQSDYIGNVNPHSELILPILEKFSCSNS